jgi:hypothetical protein
MDKSPVKDIDLNIPPRNYGPEEKFRQLRHRAKEVEQDRHKKTRRDKKKGKDYKYKIGDVFVACVEHHAFPQFYLVEVFDVIEDRPRKYGEPRRAYYCILQRTTDPDLMNRIGRLVTVEERDCNWWPGGKLTDANVENKNIKWLITE